MLDAFLVPEIEVQADGESAPVDLVGNAGKTCLATLAITDIVEQESLDVSIWGSADGQEWGAAPLLAFPQKFYKGVFQLMIDLRAHPEARFLKTKWHVNRWGVGDSKPKFSFLVKIQEQAALAALA
jgi:hypothetical protein